MDVSAPAPPRLTEKDVSNLRVLTILHYIVAALMALGGLLSIIYIVIGGALLLAPSGGQHPEGDPRMVGWLFLAIGIIAICVSWVLAGLLAWVAKSLSVRKRWTFCMVVSALHCLSFPFGTALGIFTIIVLLRENVKWVFENGES